MTVTRRVTAQLAAIIDADPALAAELTALREAVSSALSVGVLPARIDCAVGRIGRNADGGVLRALVYDRGPLPSTYSARDRIAAASILEEQARTMRLRVRDHMLAVLSSSLDGWLAAVMERSERFRASAAVIREEIQFQLSRRQPPPGSFAECRFDVGTAWSSIGAIVRTPAPVDRAVLARCFAVLGASSPEIGAALNGSHRYGSEPALAVWRGFGQPLIRPIAKRRGQLEVVKIRLTQAALVRDTDAATTRYATSIYDLYTAPNSLWRPPPRPADVPIYRVPPRTLRVNQALI